MQRQAVQSIGWYGVVAILAAYVFISLHLLSVDNAWYQALNLTGALAIVVEAASKKDRQPMALNIIWALVALIALIRLWAR